MMTILNRTLALVCFVGAITLSAFAHAADSKAIREGVAVLHGTKGNEGVSGLVTFTQKGNQVEIAGVVHGLKPNEKRAFHIHEFGDCRAEDASSAGSHYNPEGHPHALPPTTPRHSGDFGNLETDSKGDATIQVTTDMISVSGTKNPVLGHSVIVHSGVDKGTQPAGDAGGRVACGVIGIAGPPPKK